MSENLRKMCDAIRSEPPPISFENAALIIVDMQNYQISEGSITKFYETISPSITDYYLERIRNIATPNIKRILELFRHYTSTIIFTKYASICKDEADLPELVKEANRASKEFCGEPIIPHIEAESANLAPSFQPLENEIVLQKSTSGAFLNPNLAKILSERNIQQLVIVGVLTNACVENAARVGIDSGYCVVVVEDACATLDPELHNNSISAMELLGINFDKTNEFVSRYS